MTENIATIIPEDFKYYLEFLQERDNNVRYQTVEALINWLQELPISLSPDVVAAIIGSKKFSDFVLCVGDKDNNQVPKLSQSMYSRLRIYLASYTEDLRNDLFQLPIKESRVLQLNDNDFTYDAFLKSFQNLLSTKAYKTNIKTNLIHTYTSYIVLNKKHCFTGAEGEVDQHFRNIAYLIEQHPFYKDFLENCDGLFTAKTLPKHKFVQLKEYVMHFIDECYDSLQENSLQSPSS